MQPKTESLRRYSYRVMDRLLRARPRTIRRMIRDALAGLCQRAAVDRAVYFSARTRSDVVELKIRESCRCGTCGHSWQHQLQIAFPLSRFGRRVEVILQSGRPAYVSRESARGPRSSLMLEFLEAHSAEGCLLVPVMVDGTLKAVVALTHNNGQGHLSANDCFAIQLTGRVIALALQVNRRRIRQQRRIRQWKAVADNACDFAAVIDPDLQIQQVIPFRRQVDLPVPGETMASYLDETSQKTIRKSVREVMLTGEPGMCDIRAALFNSEPLWYQARIEPGSDRRREQLVVFLTNTDQQKQQSEELRELTEHLQRAARLSLLGQLSTEFAHQLNQPLQAILNWADTMNSREKRGEHNAQKNIESIKRIIESAEHASRIICRIREFVQHRTLQLRKTDLRRLVDRAILMAEPRLMDHQVELILEDQLDSDRLPVSIMVDETQTTHVLLNLLVNAAEACTEITTRPRQIMVILEQDENAGIVTIRVRDNGPGIAGESPNHVFEKFHTTKSEGLGLGLSISREVVESQRGRIWCENNPDYGCTFALTLRMFRDDGTDTVEIPIIRDQNPDF
ncbi:MAG: GHKL domain-containing protein [Planctomycetaceae bacterium]|nr:GHKL domain-containing protein [Planctomycetaceae bacterium]